MTRAEIEAGLLEYLAKQPGWVRAGAPGSAGRELMENRVLDSLALLAFVSFVESFCGIEVPSDDITEEHFNNVDDLLRYIDTKRGSLEEAS